ncbi:MAG: type IV pilus twitching motility protein PilT [Eubacteriales bacterium]
MYDINSVIADARRLRSSDIHISEGMPLCFRINGALTVQDSDLAPETARALILSMLPDVQRTRFESGEDVDFAIAVPDGGRCRVNIFHYGLDGTRLSGGVTAIAATIRLLDDYIPPLESLGLPPVLKTLSELPRGLILVTGPTGSGKSTTLASMINYINTTRAEHIITVEDPVEYVYGRAKSVIHQREVGRDVGNFAAALRSALREDPDVILIGEMRDYETISAALTAAETGHLVMSTLHTTGAAQTVDRIIDACPPSAQHQIRSQLAGILRGIITQCLIKRSDGGGRVPATEVLIGTDATLNLIREDKCHQLGTLMQSGAAAGMHTLNSDLTRLVKAGTITREDAYKYSNDVKSLADFIGNTRTF